MPIDTDRLDVSLVIPVFNEADNLPRLYDAIVLALADIDSWEVILVDDGSCDESLRLLHEINARDARFRVISFRRNFGQTAAFAAGFDHVRGDVVVTMDADLQNDPLDIPELLETMREGNYDIVSGWRINRQDGLVLRKVPSRIANWLISKVTHVTLHDYGCSLKAYRREVTDNVHLYGELHRFIPALASWMGVRIKEIPVRHHARQFGASKYGISRTTRVLLDLFTVSFLLSYSAKPMQMFGKWGLISGAVGFLLALYLTILKLTTEMALSDRPLLFLAILLIIVGIQLVTMGLLGEIMVRTYHETQHKPIYAIREILGSEPSTDGGDTSVTRHVHN